MARNIYFIGTAGSGKSTMVSAFHDWMENLDLDTVIVNLDPGAEDLLYEADIDIREWILLSDVMEEYELGPNGAQVFCADLLAIKAKEVAEVMDTFKTNYFLIDTPGQIELFAFRESSRVIIDAFGRDESFIAFLSEAGLARSAHGLLSLIMLAATVQFRLGLPMLNVLSKSDLLSGEEVMEAVERSSQPQRLCGDLGEEIVPQSLMSLELFKALENVGAFKALTPVSSNAMQGLEDVYNAIQQHFEGGEDLTKD